MTKKNASTTTVVEEQKPETSEVTEQQPETSKTKKQGWLMRHLNPAEEPLTAKRAWHESTYGTGTYVPDDVKVNAKIEQITTLIKSKFKLNSVQTKFAHENNGEYFCAVSIEPDIAQYADTIMKPFRDNGFQVVQNTLPECQNWGLTYLIGWFGAYNG